MSFTHLHCHSHYSLLDGLSKVEPLVNKAKDLGMDSLALTDHGALHGAIEFYNRCIDNEIKPIVGMEAYVAPRSRHDKAGRSDADYYHLTLLAKNYKGYRNLILLTTAAHLEGYYYKPRIDKELLRKYGDGLIALSGCQRGEIARAVVGDPGHASRILDEYLDIFGKDNFYLEVQRNAIVNRDEQEKLNQAIIALSKSTGIGLVATQDSHYLAPDDAEAQDVLVCIGTGKTVTDSNRLDMRGSDLSLASPENMEERFNDLPEAIANTQIIAQQCDLEIPINQRYFPKVSLPPGKTSEQYLQDLVNDNAPKIYGAGGNVPEAVKERLDYELEIIRGKGFAPYFLMVADIVKGVHEIGAITNTRGSAAGSIVARVLEISTIDPIYYQLPFERFLTPTRPTPPDIDLDISDNRRDEAIQWITQKYGHDNVAQIITFGTMMARAAVRDVGRALGVSYSKCDRIAKMIPFGKQGFHMTLDKALGINAELRDIFQRDPETNKILTIAKKLEGCARHASIHAAGIVITPGPLTDYVPLQREPDGQRLITQYDMYALDVGADSKAIGVIKLDLLGIRNLSILEEAVKIVAARRGVNVDLAHLPHPDPKTFQLLADGLTFGVFQLGSSGITRYLKELKPKNIFDIMAMIALYRPGPMNIIPEYIARKHDPKRIAYFDPRMKDYLERSLGLLVYQDDVLLTAINIAGYSWEEADKLRKAMGKKILSEMAKQKFKFIEGCFENGIPRKKAEELFKLIEPFAAYGFGKAHAASYSQVSYQTAFMKANYPVEFMAALMTAESGDEDKIYAAVEECKHLGITVLPPDVNESRSGFTAVDDNTIRFGLHAIKNLGSDVIQTVIDTHQDQPFVSLEDFLMRAYHKNLNKKSWEALVKSGALDRFGERGQLLANTDTILHFLRDQFRSDNDGQASLFSVSQHPRLSLRPAAAASPQESLAWEKEHLGLYVSSHPLNDHTKPLEQLLPVRQLPERSLNSTVTIGGIISKLKRMLTKKNDPMAFFTLQDFTGSVEVIVFPTVMQEFVPFLDPDRVVQVTGRVSDKDGEFKIIAEAVSALPTSDEYDQALSTMEHSKQVVIHVHNANNAQALNKIKEVVTKHPGFAQVYLQVGPTSGGKRIKTKTQVRISRDLVQDLKAIPEVNLVSED